MSPCRARARAGLAGAVTAAVGTAVVLLLSGTAPGAAVPPGTPPAVDQSTVAPGAAAGRDWRTLFARAARAARELDYAGETLWVSWSSGRPVVRRSTVVNVGGAELSMRSADGYSLWLDHDGVGSLVDHDAGWRMPLPAPDRPGRGLARMAAKYRVLRTGTERLLDRACERVEVLRRADGSLRERLWFDDDTGLLLRRETYDGADRELFLAVYLSLDLGPDAAGSTPRPLPSPPSRDGARALGVREQGVVPLDRAKLEALRAAEWTVVDELPAGYRRTGAYAVSTDQGQPLQLVFSDGLYTVSLYQQRGTLDPEALPPGATELEAVDWPVLQWPDAVPSRLVWEAQGTTFSLVGDVPSDELLPLLNALPRPEPVPLPERLRRGVSRLWSWVSPWG